VTSNLKSGQHDFLVVAQAQQATEPGAAGLCQGDAARQVDLPSSALLRMDSALALVSIGINLSVRSGACGNRPHIQAGQGIAHSKQPISSTTCLASKVTAKSERARRDVIRAEWGNLLPQSAFSTATRSAQEHRRRTSVLFTTATLTPSTNPTPRPIKGRRNNGE
jgi:hypothetical protein